MAQSLPWKTAWVTGASTGIGREIVLQLTAAGVNVAASARSAEKLGAFGPSIVSIPLDVTDADACRAAAERIESELGPIDLVVFGAGTYAPVAIDSIDPKLFAHTMETNYMGVVNCLAAVAPRMMARGKGQISWIASVAGFMGLPKAAAYGPTKAALINLAECLEPEMKLKGVRISVINPGFVATPLTAQNDFDMPFLMQPDEAARRTIAGLAEGRFEIAYPRRFVAILRILRTLPYPLFFRFITRFVLKAA
ncbi:MAG: SDR family NAD(P)-dependent oxidoreductase [Aestuariivirga sp.]|uniref:SDR family NAD(P)-dependent oxidoreductase n=1 Tax=Aestuariivirga sp. TaxID=2650926 RepID=UPI0025BF3AED|nr:SDR family NAD(P)-dependent oxidoreductase [Aestuariivirga sp.]MCA3561442.1 SDR family NAD(P)-dependent oxidoreductase [Aestuariivirga sp.]